MTNQTTRNEHCYARIEPVLQNAGYETRRMESGRLLVVNGDVHFAIDVRPEVADSTYTRIWFENRFRDEHAEELFAKGVLLITNRLSGIYPEFNVVCSNDGRIRTRYRCDIKEPQDILPHVAYACDYFGKIQVEAKQAVLELYEDLTEEAKAEAKRPSTTSVPGTIWIRRKETLSEQTPEKTHSFANRIKMEGETNPDYDIAVYYRHEGIIEYYADLDEQKKGNNHSHKQNHETA